MLRSLARNGLTSTKSLHVRLASSFHQRPSINNTLSCAHGSGNQKNIFRLCVRHKGGGGCGGGGGFSGSSFGSSRRWRGGRRGGRRGGGESGRILGIGAVSLGIGIGFYNFKKTIGLRDMSKNGAFAKSVHRDYINKNTGSSSVQSDEAARLLQKSFVVPDKVMWDGSYEENGKWGQTWYSLQFSDDDLNDGTCAITGDGADADGSFRFEHGMANFATRRFAWSERSPSGLYANCEAECVDETCSQLHGTYKATTGVSGQLKLQRQEK